MTSPGFQSCTTDLPRQAFLQVRKWLTRFSARLTITIHSRWYGPAPPCVCSTGLRRNKVTTFGKNTFLEERPNWLLCLGCYKSVRVSSSAGKASCRFSHRLPRYELKVVLYPSSQMQGAVSKSYAHLVEFLVHALHWHQKRRDERLVPFSNLSPSTSKTNLRELKRY
jgi:hypothetical protein